MLRRLLNSWTVEIAAAVAFAVLVCALAARGDDCGPTSAVRCTEVKLHDGDTVHCSIYLGWGVTLRDKSIRAFGYDAPEINRVRQTVTITDAEIEQGKAAKAALEQLIAGGELWCEDSGERDPYGRISARLWVKREDSWVDVARWMKQRKYTR